MNTVVAENSAGDVGGGLYTNGLIELNSSTVVNNLSGSDAGFGGGGLSTFGPGLFQLENSLLAGNLSGTDIANCGCTGGSCASADFFESDGYNLEDADTCALDQTTDLVDTDPMLRPIGAYGGTFDTVALLPGSPAIDAGSPLCQATDARGAARPVDGSGNGAPACDIGAYEYDPREIDNDGDEHCIGVPIDGNLYCADGSSPGDCDDSDPALFPGNPEVCDGLDNDCNTLADDTLLFEDWYADADQDTFGDPATLISTCDGAPTGYVADNTDCDDTSAAIAPDAIEICNSIDDDCDTLSDDADDSVDPTTFSTWYLDNDADGYGDIATETQACDPGAGYVEDSTDCDDATSEVSPGATEICNSIDDDCDTLSDDADDSVAATDEWFMDGDGDGFGDPDMSLLACVVPDGYVDDATDCDDGSADVHPGAEEIKNDIDDDCDGLSDKDDEDLGGCGCSSTTAAPSSAGLVLLASAGLILRRRRS